MTTILRSSTFLYFICTSLFSFKVFATTTPPVLTSPTAGSTHATTVSVEYTLPDTPLSGSVSLGFASATNTIVLEMNTTSPVSFTLDPSVNPVTAHPTFVNAITGGTSIPDGVYTVTLSYQNASADPTAARAVASVTIGSSSDAAAAAASAEGGCQLRATHRLNNHFIFGFIAFVGTLFFIRRMRAR